MATLLLQFKLLLLLVGLFVLERYLLEVKKSLSHAHIGLL